MFKPVFKISKRETFLLILFTLVLLAILAIPFFKTHAQGSSSQVKGGYIHLQQQDKNLLSNQYTDVSVNVIKVDGCQYIVVLGLTNGHGGVSMVHKENCENPWHKEKR